MSAIQRHHKRSPDSQASDPRGIAVRGRYAYLSTDLDLCVVDISKPEEPAIEARREIPSGADIVVTQELLFHLTWEGLAIFDIADPADPQSRGTLTGFREPTAVAAIGRTTNGADWNDLTAISRLFVIDAEEPDLPSDVILIVQRGRMGGLAAGGEVLLAAASDSGSLVFGVSDPVRPVSALNLSPPAPVVFADDRTHLATGDNGLCVYDVAGRARPEALDCTPTSGWSARRPSTLRSKSSSRLMTR